MEARVIFTNQFKEKTMAKISKRKMGELRWEKLKQAERDGSLQKVSTRKQLGALVGIRNSQLAHKWVYTLIGRGQIVETLVGRHGNRNEYEYHLGVKTTKTSKRKTPVVKNPTVDYYVHTGNISETLKNNEESCKDKGNVRVSLIMGSRVVSMEGVSADFALAIINGLK